MKIAYVGSFQRLYDEEGIARSFEKLGHTVLRFEESEFSDSSVGEIICEKPDFLLGAKYKIDEWLARLLLKECSANGIQTVCWVPDLYFGLYREGRVRSKTPMFSCDVVFTPDGGHNEEWKKARINHKLLRQGIFDESIGIGESSLSPYDADVCFIGSENHAFPYRQELNRRLKERYESRFLWVGKDNAREVRGSKLNNLLATVPVVVGDSVYSPYYWSNRVYEVIGRGGFIIHPNIEGLEEEFVFYKELVPYHYGNWNELFEQIEYYLSHQDKRIEIISSGMKRVRECHTLVHRCQQLLANL